MKVTLAVLLVTVALVTMAQAPRRVILEHETGAWGGYCPRGASTMDTALMAYPNVIGIENHYGDIMANSYTNTIDLTLNDYGYPGGMIDRYKFPSEFLVVLSTYKWVASCSTRVNTTAPLYVDLLTVYDTLTRNLSVDVMVTFADSASGDMRISCLLLEDSVNGGTSGYYQANYMGIGCGATDPNSPWYTYPCVITNYRHRHVARVNLAPDWGTAGVIPDSVSPGQQFTQNYNYTVPGTWNDDRVEIVAFVSSYDSLNYQNRSVINANMFKLGPDTVFTGNREAMASGDQINIKPNYPNPFSELTAFRFRLNAPGNVSVRIYNLLGMEVKTLVNRYLVPGEHAFFWMGEDMQGNPLPAGMYLFKVSTFSEIKTGNVLLVR